MCYIVCIWTAVNCTVSNWDTRNVVDLTAMSFCRMLWTLMSYDYDLPTNTEQVPSGCLKSFELSGCGQRTVRVSGNRSCGLWGGVFLAWFLLKRSDCYLGSLDARWTIFTSLVVFFKTFLSSCWGTHGCPWKAAAIGCDWSAKMFR